jgi:hypothetical protein
MICGSGGSFGAGIYFAWNPTNAKNWAAHGRDAVVTATVTLYNPVRLYAGWGDLTLHTLWLKGFDSVVYSVGPGLEMVIVYRSDVVQVVS